MNYRITATALCLLLYIISYLMVLPLYAQEIQIPEKIFCTNCSADNPAVNKFCYQCGTVLLKRGPKEKMRDTGGDSVRGEGLEKPADIGITPPDPAVEIKVKAIYDFGSLLFKEKDYTEALVQFYKIIHDFPDSQYYEGAFVMREACRRMLLFQDEPRQKKEYARPASFNSSIQKGCLGFLGVVGAILLIGAIAG